MQVLSNIKRLYQTARLSDSAGSRLPTPYSRLPTPDSLLPKTRIIQVLHKKLFQ
ncbi:hypothetical protein [Moorena sp. SIO4G3]|uniref:hypothetical protein n=1 Tax=Moorena sp. SIO4G3 TaxID=2607821 RepID=UPI00142AB12F|nr:hypothetical protein [Moorena sp. SIO4G3]NEO81191.1 hypothetical protein [Moorena sp. SIO4G3]